ncbi:MAG: universal stress protein [Gammaproteobacteria bacterium]|nr:universal stress protein [Gammaproteobacteria bacterium]
MKRFKNVLFLADRHPVPSQTLGRAIRLARGNKARLTVLAVAESVDELDHNPELDGLSVKNALQIELLRGIDDALDKLDADDRRRVDIRTRAELGIPFLIAIREVASHGIDLLIKAAERPPGPVQRLLGSTDMHLLRKAPCPVWIEPESDMPHHRRIVAAIDPLSDAADGLDQTILELATSLAISEGADLHVVHAWHLPGEEMLSRGRALISETELQQLRTSTEKRHREAVAQTLRAFRTLPLPIHEYFVNGMPDESIQQIADSRNADLIVMGTLGRTGIPGFFIGNTAERVLSNATCGVLAVKPVGFQSPVLAA